MFRRHPQVLIVAQHPLHHRAACSVARDDGILVDTLGRIEPQPRLARFFIQTMTLEAVVRQDWTHVPAKIGRGCCQRGSHKCWQKKQ